VPSKSGTGFVPGHATKQRFRARRSDARFGPSFRHQRNRFPLPQGVLALGALHEIVGGGLGAVHGAAAVLFAAGAPALVIRRWRTPAAAADFGQPTAATTRWRISALPSSPLPVAGVVGCAGSSSSSAAVPEIARNGNWRPAMPRAVSLYLPVWPADRLRRQLGAAVPLPKKPLVFAGQDGGRRTVVAANPAALALALHPGLALAEAQALVPDLYVAAADPAADAAALKRLALCALRRYSPLIAVDPPDGLLIGAAGVAIFLAAKPRCWMTSWPAFGRRTSMPARPRGYDRRGACACPFWRGASGTCCAGRNRRGHRPAPAPAGF
jgi:hypothetical protein